MLIWKKMPLTTELLSYLEDYLELVFDEGLLADIRQDVSQAFRAQLMSILASYEGLDMHFIGKWKYDTEEERYYYSEADSIVMLKLLKYYPYLKVLNDEFSAITGDESITRENSGRDVFNETESETKNRSKNGTVGEQHSQQKTETKNSSKNGTVGEQHSQQKTETKNHTSSKIDNFENSTDGVMRSAHEDMPITSAPITTAPTDASSWNMSNPTAKDGEQFNHHNESENNSSVAENDSNSVTDNISKNIQTTDSQADSDSVTDNISKNIQTTDSQADANSRATDNTTNRTFSETITKSSPEELLKILKFNIDGLNVTRVAYLVANSIVEEKNTIY